MIASHAQTNIRLAVLITCFNRLKTTVRCLNALNAQHPSAFVPTVFLVDDGSTDGTGHAVRDAFPNVWIIQGTGDLYWCGGTRLAFETALADDFDFYLWLNDDTELVPDALSKLQRVVEHADGSKPTVIVGSTFDPDTMSFSYGGWRTAPGSSLGLTRSWRKVPPDAVNAIECDTMNGNCVLIPRDVTRRIGNLDGVFRQGLGDLDYGLRARQAGCQVMIAPGFYGSCRVNPGKGFWTDRTLGAFERWRRLIGPKGLPPRAWATFCHRHKGLFWPLAWASPYLVGWWR